MRLLDASEVKARLGWTEILEVLEAAFEEPERYRTPERTAIPAAQGGSYLSMPCADAAGWFGVKQVAVLPGNRERGLPSVRAWYTLFDPDGAPALGCDATILTRQRTAAVSALAASKLVRDRASELLVVGTGGLAPWMALAHLQVRPYARVAVWGRDGARAEATVKHVLQGLPALEARPSVVVAPDLEAAVRHADVITVATTAAEPLIEGAWLRDDQHLDLVGAFMGGMAEADAEAVKGSLVYVDDLDACKAEAGDLLAAVAEGWSFDAVRGDLHGLVTDSALGGRGRTLFKSVGLAFEDLVLARLLFAKS